MKTITHLKLRSLLLSIKSATYVTFTALTEAQKSKAKSATKVFKRSRVNAIIRYNYANAVNNQDKREGGEGGFESQPRKWGKHADGSVNSPVIDHEKNGMAIHYMSAKPQSVLSTEYFNEGMKRVEKEQIAHLLRESKTPKTQDHLEKKIYPRDYAFDSIESITVMGETYQVIKG